MILAYDRSSMHFTFLFFFSYKYSWRKLSKEDQTIRIFCLFSKCVMWNGPLNLHCMLLESWSVYFDEKYFQVIRLKHLKIRHWSKGKDGFRTLVLLQICIILVKIDSWFVLGMCLFDSCLICLGYINAYANIKF